MFTVDIPYNIGDFVKVYNHFNSGEMIYGTVAGFSVFGQTSITVLISGYKSPVVGEYLLSDVTLMTNEEIEILKNSIMRGD